MNGFNNVKRFAIGLLLSPLLGGFAASDQLHLIEIDPGHSHISGLHARALPGVSDEVHLYSPLSPELVAHLAALTRFNNRLTDPTHWSVQLLAGPDYLESFKQESPGNIVALSGRNEKKLGYIAMALESGQHVFADKPWIISLADLPKLEAALRQAEKKKLVAFDWMTLRGDVAYQLQRDLIRDAAVFGQPAKGSVQEPAVRLENLHALLKFSNGVAQPRPASFLDIRQQGEGLADVGTHLVDLAEWTLFPEQAIDYRSDIHVLKAEHSPLPVSLEQFKQLTGEKQWPAYLQPDIADNKIKYLANGSCVFTIRGVHVLMKVGWQFQAQVGAQDSYLALYRGTRSTIELRAGAEEHYVPEIYVSPGQGVSRAELEMNLKAALARLSGRYTGLSLEEADGRFHVLIPKASRAGDDLQVIFKQFAGFVHDYRTFPPFENANLLTKYYVTTKAVAMARSN